MRVFDSVQTCQKANYVQSSISRIQLKGSEILTLAAAPPTPPSGSARRAAAGSRAVSPEPSQ